MRTALFIKSYKKDFEWLSYCLKSIQKYCSGYHEVVIVVPNNEIHELPLVIPKGFNVPFRLAGTEEYGDGYLYQQMIKMNAHNFTDAEYIQYFDSDCIFLTPTSPEDYFENGKPAMLKTRYGNLEGAEVWKQVVQDALGFTPEFEYMRRHGLTYHRSTLENIQKMFPTINDHIMTRPARHFSEFNVMGAFAEKFEPENYIWKDTEFTPFVPERLKQFWSYSGVTEEIKAEIEKLIS